MKSKVILGFSILLAMNFFLLSCSSSSAISNGAYSDISLNRDSDEYELKRLNEINVEGKALFGIPGRAKKKEGVVVRFNGIDLGRSNRAVPILTLLVYTLASGILVDEIVGTNNSGDKVIPVPLNYVVGFPLAGVLNNMTWSGSALQNASWNLNSQLLEENPDVDLFLNPKYEIEYTQGVFSQKARVRTKVMGARIQTDE